jgi:hypothetical protein
MRTTIAAALAAALAAMVAAGAALTPAHAPATAPTDCTAAAHAAADKATADLHAAWVHYYLPDDHRRYLDAWGEAFTAAARACRAPAD